MEGMTNFSTPAKKAHFPFASNFHEFPEENSPHLCHSMRRRRGIAISLLAKLKTTSFGNFDTLIMRISMRFLWEGKVIVIPAGWSRQFGIE
jgi:hypothetical protein